MAASCGTRSSAAVLLTLQDKKVFLEEGFNSLAPGRPGCHFKTAIFNLVLLIGIFTSYNHNALRWMPWDFTKDKSTLVQVMAWCRQATSHYLSQCWPRSMSPYGVTKHQWVNYWQHLSIKKWLKMRIIYVTWKQFSMYRWLSARLYGNSIALAMELSQFCANQLV